jgi:uncharacterized protein (DUF433 family)
MSLMAETPPLPLRADEHGVMRVGQTRVRLDSVLTTWKQGATPEQIVENFDTLSLADVYSVIGFYLNHTSEVEAYLEKNKVAGEKLKLENEQRFPQTGLRERLLARRTKEE